jgi:hypothetical protein
VNEVVEDAVVQALRARGGGAVDVGRLRVGTVARARTIRRRRIGLTGTAVTAALVGAAALAPGLAGSPPVGAGSPVVSASRPGTGGGVTTTLPPSDRPGAAARPDLVAQDPATFHFDVDTAAIGATGISYYNQGGAETAQAWSGTAGHFTTWYTLAQQRATLDLRGSIGSAPGEPAVDTQVAGRPAKMVRYPGGVDGTHPVFEVTWQPVDGLWARVSVEADDGAAALNAAAALRLGHDAIFRPLRMQLSFSSHKILNHNRCVNKYL